MPIDAVPDLTNVQVLTQSAGLGPVEVAQFITFPVETSLSGLPRIEEIRSLSLPGISAITVVFEEGTDIYWARNLISDDCRKLAPQIRYGAATRDGRGEIVTGTAMLLIGGNSRVVAQRVRERLAEIEKSLPDGMVIVMLFLLLGNCRAGLIVAASIPLSALFMFTAMYLAGVPANLMSLGALDFGIIVDGSVVMVE